MPGEKFRVGDAFSRMQKTCIILEMQFAKSCNV